MAERQFVALSRREKQRVLVARALAQEPEMIVLDEPSNVSDARDQFEALSSAYDLGITMVAVVRDPHLIAGFATRLLALKNGKIIGYGTPDTTLAAAIKQGCFDGPSDSAPLAIHHDTRRSISEHRLGME
jgi:iron complex transport system ATP-binding protein